MFLDSLIDQEEMEIEFTKDFFVSNDYEQILKNQFQKIDCYNPYQMKSFYCNILKNKDIYISFYLSTQITPKCEFVDDELLTIIENLLYRYKNINKFKLVDIHKITKDIIYKKMSNCISIDVFCKSLYRLDFNDKELDYYRDFFGYSQMYKYFRSMVNEILDNEREYRIIGMVFKMLNSSNLVFNSLLPVFERLTRHVNDNFIDSNILKCIEVLKAVVFYQPEVLEEKGDYVASVASFLVQIFTQPENFKFLSFQDLNKILKGIKIFAFFCMKFPKMVNISTGVFKKSFDALKELIDRKTTVYEEFISITCMLKVLFIYFEVSIEMGSRIFNYDEIDQYVQKINHEMPKGVYKNEWTVITNKFYKIKYKFLDYLSKLIQEAPFNSKIFMEDLDNVENKLCIINTIKNLKKYIEWDKLIAIAAKKENVDDFIEFILDEYFFCENKDHLHYVEIFIDSLVKYDNQDLVLFATHALLSKWIEKRMTDAKSQIILTLYFDSIDNFLDQRILKKRKYIINFLYYKIDQTEINNLLENLIQRKEIELVQKFNKNILILFLVLARKTRNLSEDIINSTCKYFIDLIVFNYESIDNSQFTDTCNLFIAGIAEILWFHKKEIFFSDKDYRYCTNTYVKLIIAILCYINDKENVDYLKKFNNYLLNFLFSANIDQRNELGILFKRCDEHIDIDYDENCELINKCFFIRNKYNLL